MPCSRSEVPWRKRYTPHQALIKFCVPFATSIHFFTQNITKFDAFSVQVPPKMDAKILLKRLLPPHRANFSNFSFQKHKQIKNVHATWKKYPQVAKKTSKTPSKSLPKSVQNTIKNSIEKNTSFNTVFFIIWNAQNMKNVAPVEAKRYILQNRRFQKKYEKDLPKPFQNTSQNPKNPRNNDFENKSGSERPILFRSF